ncbi:cache domain-containing protein [Leptothrix discophora]|uniref:histidine kinase n=1 Tax=Leptothrix discophora TaxID=89 RepID=A0ABT9FZR5_LEPDI|nr:cache domain-containing protein [Leptothrix discophora]MDP4299651.1 cache domain-containing protein [Leptothrix discophora]
MSFAAATSPRHETHGLRALRRQLLLLAALPLLASLLLIALAVRHQTQELAASERDLVQSAYLSSKRTELKRSVDLALSVIQPLYDTGRDDEIIKGEAKRLLRSLDNGGGDHYFFAYDFEGLCLVLPPQPELEGQNLWEVRDRDGRPVVQSLIAKAREGSGFFQYVWNKPSLRAEVPKMGYVVGLQRWGWMMGSGLYLDDIDATLHELEQRARDNIWATMAWITAIALLGIALVGGCALVLNLNGARAADAQLQLMARQVVQSQEAERAHLSRELHDGTGQTLVSIKLLMDSAIGQLRRLGPNAAPPTLDKARDRIEDALGEIRNLSHRLRPPLLDTFGLPAALRHLGEEFAEHADLAFFLRERGPAVDLPDEIKTVLFRVTQEALTNIQRHARASRVDLRLVFSASGLRLTVQDDGVGYDAAALRDDPRRGIGLRNMDERLASIGGRLRMQSRPGMTRVVADVPREAIRRFSNPASPATQAPAIPPLEETTAHAHRPGR